MEWYMLATTLTADALPAGVAFICLRRTTGCRSQLAVEVAPVVPQRYYSQDENTEMV
jgi:hypothetical protein